MTHPTQEDDVKAIRDALALGPRAWGYDSNQTPFYNDAEGHSRGGDDDGTYCLFGADFFIDGERYDGPVLSEQCSKADAYFIAEANPERLTRLLAKLEQAERDAGRYAWTLHNLGLIEAHALKWKPAVHKPLLVYVQDFIDAHIAAIASGAKT